MRQINQSNTHTHDGHQMDESEKRSIISEYSDRSASRSDTKKTPLGSQSKKTSSKKRDQKKVQFDESLSASYNPAESANLSNLGSYGNKTKKKDSSEKLKLTNERGKKLNKSGSNNNSNLNQNLNNSVNSKKSPFKINEYKNVVSPRNVSENKKL